MVDGARIDIDADHLGCGAGQNRRPETFAASDVERDFSTHGLRTCGVAMVMLVGNLAVLGWDEALAGEGKIRWRDGGLEFHGFRKANSR